MEDAGRRVEFSLDDLPACPADPALLGQVFANLLSNALTFTRRRAEARIEVGCRRTGSECIYFVKDNGVGFGTRYAGKPFGVFRRLHGAEEYEGTGVGLAIVQRIVHHHGGRVWAEVDFRQFIEAMRQLGLYRLLLNQPPPLQRAAERFSCGGLSADASLPPVAHLAPGCPPRPAEEGLAQGNAPARSLPPSEPQRPVR